MIAKGKIKFILVALVCAVSAMLATFAAGCSASVEYSLESDENGEKYYCVKGSGYISALDGELEIPAYYGEGENYAPVKQIADRAFCNSSITKVTIPATVESIGNAAFAYCYFLSEVRFEQGISITQIARGMFGGCSALESVTIPEGVTTVCDLAFTDCSSLESAILPSTLESIGRDGFSNCGKLTGVQFPAGLKEVGDSAFYRTALTELDLPESLTRLGICAFHSCERLTNARISGEVEVLPSGVFGYCVSLKTISLPATIKRVDGPPI